MQSSHQDESWFIKNRMILILILLGFLLNFTSNFSLVLGASIFLKKQGASSIPYFYMLLNSLSIVMGLLLFRLNLPARPSLLVCTGTMSSVFFIFSRLEEISGGAMVYLVYVCAGLFHIYCFIFFWNFLNQTLTLRQLKTWVGPMSGIFSFGAILSGFLMKPVLKALPLSSCFLVGSVVYVSMFLILLLVLKSSKKSDSEKREKEEKKAVLSDSLVVMIAFCVFFYAFIRYFQDYRYSVAITSLYKNEMDLAVFMGTFNSVLRTLTIVYHMSFSSKVLRGMSVGRAMSIVPILIPFICLACIFLDSPWAVISFQFLLIFGLNAFTQPTTNVLFSALSSEIKSRARFFCEGVIFCLAVLLSGGMSVIYDSFALPAQAFFITILIVALVWIYLSGKLSIVYLSSLKTNLSGGDGVRASEVFFTQSMVSQASYTSQVSENLRFKTRGREHNVRRLVSQCYDPGVREIIREFFQPSEDEWLRLSLIRNLCRQDYDEFFENEIRETTQQKFDHQKTIHLLDSLALTAKPRYLELVRPYLQSDVPSIRIRAVLQILKQSTWTAEIESAVKILIQCMKKGEEDRIYGLRALGELGLECFLPAIESQLNDPSKKIRQAAVSAAGKIDSVHVGTILRKQYQVEEDRRVKLLIEDRLQRLEGRSFHDLERIVSGKPHEYKQRFYSCMRLLALEDLPCAMNAVQTEKDSGILLLELLARYQNISTLASGIRLSLSQKELHFRGVFKALLDRCLEGKEAEDAYLDCFHRLGKLQPYYYQEELAYFLNSLYEGNYETGLNSHSLKQFLAIVCEPVLDQEVLIKSIDQILSREQGQLDIAMEWLENSLDHHELKGALQSLLDLASRIY